MTQLSTGPGSQALVPWQLSTEQVYRDLMSNVVEPVKEINPYLIWMTGKLPTSDRQMPVGWHVHKGANPHLDALLVRLKYKHHLIEHENEKGEVELVDYWALNYRWDPSVGTRGDYVLVPVSLFVLAFGVRDKREMKKPQVRDGVAYGWEVDLDRAKNVVLKPNGEPKKTAKLKFRAYIHELLPSPDVLWDESNGFTTWFQVSVSGFLVDDAFTMLYSQYRSMHAYDQRVNPNGATGDKTPYWVLSNPTVPSNTPRRVTSRLKEGQSTSIIPMHSLIPSAESQITDEFLQQHRVPLDLQQAILQDDVLMETWNWSREESEYLEGVKPRPTLAQGETSVTVPGVVVVEEHSAKPTLAPSEPADPVIDAAQHQVLLMLCNQDPSKIQAVCQEYQVSDFAQLRVSQFRQLLGQLSQPQG